MNIWRRWHAPATGFLLVAATSALLVGCTGAPTTDGTPSASSAAMPVVPHGSTTVGCDASRPATPDPRPDDLLIGPLIYGGLRNGYPVQPAPPSPDEDGVRFFKIGAELPADATVTVSIGESARSVAGIQTEAGPSYGYSTVRYESCPAGTQQSTAFWWVGGFTLVGRASACVPLDVTVRGESEPHHHDLAIPVGACG